MNSMHEDYSKALYFAVLDADLEIIEILLNHGANINARNECGSSPLLCAIRMGKHKIVDLLLKKGTNPKYYNDGYSPLHLAAEQALFSISEQLSSGSSKSSEEQLEFLPFENENFIRVKFPVDDNDRTKNMITTLYLVVLNCHREPTKFFMDHKVIIDTEFGNGETLCCDVCKGLSMIFEDILTYYPSSDTNNESTLDSAKIDTGSGFDSKKSTIVENLLKYGFLVINDNVNEAVLWFNDFKHAYITMIQEYFLKMFHGACLPCERYENIIFHIMTKNEQVEIAKFLFEPIYDALGTTGYPYPILYTFKISDVNLTQIVLLHGPQSSPFYEFGCQKKTSNVVDIFYEYKAEVNCTTNDSSPLQIAAYRGDEETIKMLIANGMNVNSKRRNGDTALHIVARTCHTNILKILLENGADVYAKNIDGATPLHVASEGNHPEIVSILLQHGSPVDSTNIYGRTPLHTAINFLKSEILKLLLKFGADTSGYTMLLAFHRLTPITNDKENLEHQKIKHILKCNFIMLRSANLYIDEQNESFMRNTGLVPCPMTHVGCSYKSTYWEHNCDVIEFEKECKNEIQRAKCEEIPNTKLSFYDILTKNMQSLARYASNEDIIRTFESENYKAKFPIYAPIFERNLKRALLCERAKEIFYWNFQLPYECSEQIFQYLEPTDIESLMYGKPIDLQKND